MTQVTVRRVLAMRTARSIRCRTWLGTLAMRDEVGGDVLEQRLQVDFLLVVRADRRARLLADDGDHRHVVHLGVVQPVQQMDRARAGGRVAEPDLAGELGMRRRP